MAILQILTDLVQNLAGLLCENYEHLGSDHTPMCRRVIFLRLPALWRG